MQGNFTAAAVVCALALLIACNRRWTWKKTRGWRPTVGTVTATCTHLIGDSSAVFVDATYLFNGLRVHVRNVLTDGNSVAEYPIDCQIQLLVDPKNPKRCILEKLVHQF
ncbi:DUF3592 domain-containing protein [Rhizobium sp. rho-13.1]|nr:DUF3592 domain-containing protein [Rhizobium sp. rho-13.1]TQY07017.1 DUF3592 domain-containing protein [Rhizobium sp. rho-1.1]